MLFDDYAVYTRPAYLGRWFVATGALGIAVAVSLAVGMSYDLVSSNIITAFWPAAMVQLIDPKTTGSKIIVVLIAYGSNFLIYGLLGAGVGFAVSRLFRFPKGAK